MFCGTSFLAFRIVSFKSEQYKSIDLLASSFPGIGKSIPSGFEFVSKIAIIGIPSFIDSFIADNAETLNILKWFGVVYLFYLSYDIYKSSPKNFTNTSIKYIE